MSATEGTKHKNANRGLCSVPECGMDKKLRPEVGFFKLPLNPERSQLWLKNICLLKPEGPVFVCAEHFADEAISKSNPNKRKLTQDAVPTLKLPSCPEFVNLSEGNSKPKVQTNTTDAETLLVTQAQVQKKTVAETKNIIECSKEQILGIVKGASAYTLQIHAIQTKMENLSNHRTEYLQLSLKLYLRYPKAYQHLQKALALPPKSELRDVFKNTVISTEKVTVFPIYLSHKGNTMKAKQKQCFISIGETKIKPRIYYDIKKDHFLGIHDLDDALIPEPATTAVVLIAQGIFEEWKQPVAVGYLADNSPSIKPWVDKNIKCLLEIGFNVRAVVYQKESKYFSTNNHVFYSNSKKKIFYIHDISSLFTNFYYNFTKCDYCFDKMIAKRQHIVDYYDLDSQKEMPLTPKLTEKHINPTNIQMLDIKSVMEVFSMTTAAAISTYIDFKILNVIARNTVQLIAKMSKLYDIFNTGRSADGSYSKGFTGKASQIFFLTDMLSFFNGLNIVIPEAKSSPSLEKSHKSLMDTFKINIKSILSLSKDLKSENYEDLPVWKFTTSASELFFDQVQKHSKSITKPTAREVDSIFRQTAVIHLLKCPIKDFSPIQTQNVLSEFQIIINGFKLLRDFYACRNLDANDYCISSSEYNALEMERKDAIIFLAGFLLKKCTEVHDCEELKTYNSKSASNLETLSMCESIIDEYWKKNCVLPRAQFVEFVESMEILFRTFMNKDILCVTNKKILYSLMKSLGSMDIPMPCKCFPFIYVKKLYARFRIYHTLKYNNEIIKTKRSGRIVINKL